MFQCKTQGDIDHRDDDTDDRHYNKLLVLVKKWVGKYSIIYTTNKLCVEMSFTV